MSSCAVCIFVNSFGSPIILAAFLASRQVSSNLVMTRTMVPSSTSVRSVIRLNDIPLAHSYTTSTRPNRGRLTKSFESLLERMTWCLICIAFTFSDMRIISALPRSSAGVKVGSTSVFSWKTNADNNATTSSGSKSARTFSRMSSVSTNSSAECI